MGKGTEMLDKIIVTQLEICRFVDARQDLTYISDHSPDKLERESVAFLSEKTSFLSQLYFAYKFQCPPAVS